MRKRDPGQITGEVSRSFGLDVQINRKQGSGMYPSGSPSEDGLVGAGKSITDMAPGNRMYREVIPPGEIGSKETYDPQLPPGQYVDTVQYYENEQNDPKLHGPMQAMRSADRGVPFQAYGPAFQPRRAPMPRAAQDDLYLEGPGKQTADPRMQGRDSSDSVFPARRETVDNCDLYGDNVAGVLHNNKAKKG